MQTATEITIPSSTEKIPVYVKEVKSGAVDRHRSIRRRAADSPTLRASGTEMSSIPFLMRTPNGSLTLSWNHRTGKVDGRGADYQVHSWDVIGP